MENIDIEVVADPDLDEPVLVEGLPGVGHVGKLVAEHLVEEFDGELIRRVYSTDFPPQVTVEDDGVAELTHAQFHHVHIPPKGEWDGGRESADGADDASDGEEGTDDPATAADGSGEDAEAADADEGSDDGGVDPSEIGAEDPDGQDLLVLTGDHQAASNEGHYTLTDAFLDVAEEFGCERAFALGGVPTGELIEDDEYDVLGALTDAADREAFEDAGVEFREDEPAGGIVGVSGLVLGLGARRGLSAACLMGETSGYLVDPKSAQSVLVVLQELLDVEVDFSDLEDRAEEMEEVVGKIQEMQGGGGGGVPSEDELRYIG